MLVAVIDDPVGRKASRSLDVICIGTVGLLAMLAALDEIDEEEAWRLHSQMTNLTTGPYRSPIKSKFDFSQLVKDVARKMHL
jgi:predicted nucleic acid-binding protein